MPNTRNVARAAEIVRMHESEGMTYTAIGERLGISKGRVHDIYTRDLAIRNRQYARAEGDETVGASPLSVRAVNCLKNAGFSDHTTRDQIAIWLRDHPRKEIIKMRNLGHHSLKEIESWALADKGVVTE